MGKSFNTGLLTNGIAQDSSNNIGIGGAVDASYKLKVTGTTLTTGAATFSSTLATGGNISLNNNSGILYWNNTGGGTQYGYIQGSTGLMNLQVASGGDINFGNGTDLVRIKANGNVGIGTNNPLWTLDSRGTIAAMGAGSDGTLGDCIIFGNAGFPSTQNNRARSSTSASGASNYLTFETSNGTTGSYNTNQFVLRGNGSIGIGTLTPTSIGSYRSLTIDGTDGSIIDLRFNGTAGGRFYTSSDTAAGMESLSTTLPLIFKTQNGSGSTERMRISPAGNVGIGTTTTTWKLSVANEAVIGAQGGSDYLYLSGGSGYGSKVRTYYATGSLNNELSGNSNTLFNQVTGNVGIATASPNHKLDVNGNINIPGGNQLVFNNEASVWAILARTNTSTTNLGTGLKNIIYCGGGSGEGFAITGAGYTASFEVNNAGNVWIKGALSKGSGSFRIDHPLESMSETHQLVHSFVESPQANNIYRGKVQLENGKAKVNLDEVSTMTEGTFVLLNRDIHTYTSNETDWDAVKGKVDGNMLIIECENNQSKAIVSWLVIGERQDKHMMDTDWTDDNGKVIVEPLKKQYLEEQVDTVE